uniref:Shaggy-related protein kinase GSK2-like n=1 Tax=Dermatophagoides pteronyssinus TaxID=6956 RepID=A0A6P6YBL2_DERPT|nr:shaggy-related protein kinase GSK2-like [Dermatophagoides pteronyssinus]
MEQLYHPNIILLKDFYYTETKAPDSSLMQRYLCLVMPYIPYNLYSSIREASRHNNGFGLSEPYIKLYSYQLLRALGYMHSLGICHRDLKPQNVLVDPETNAVRLCDLGSAKRLHPGEVSVAYICSRFYRAPELMLGSCDYTCAIDLWSIGCVIAEMALGKPFFAGSTSVEQFVKIIQILGSPTKQQIESMNPEYSNFNFPEYKKVDLRQLFKKNPDLPDSFYELLSNLFKYDPSSRIHPFDALALPFFDELRDEHYRLPHGKIPPPIYNFSEHELNQMSQETKYKVIPKWLLKAKNKY